MQLGELMGNHPGIRQVLEPWLVTGFLALFFVLLLTVYTKIKPGIKEGNSSIVVRTVAIASSLLMTVQVAVSIIWFQQNADEKRFVEELEIAATVDIVDNFIVDEVNIAKSDYKENYLSVVAEMYTAPYTTEVKFKYSETHQMLLPFAMDLPENVFIKPGSDIERILNSDEPHEMNVIQNTIDEFAVQKEKTFYSNLIGIIILLGSLAINITLFIYLLSKKTPVTSSVRQPTRLGYAGFMTISSAVGLILCMVFSMIPGGFYNHDIRQVSLYNIKENYGLDHVKARDFEYDFEDNSIKTRVEATIGEDTVLAQFAYDENAGHMIQDIGASEGILEPVEGALLDQWLTQRHKELTGE